MESILRRDRWAVAGGLALVVALAWSYLLVGAGMELSALEMTRMSSAEPMSMGSAMMQMATWTLGYAIPMFLMRWIMMVAMMLPSAAPTILLAAALNRKACQDKPPYGTAGFFTAGYLLGWAAFSLVAVSVQWSLEASALLSPMMGSATSVLAGGLLITAALWQFTPLKQACLRHCRSPLHFLTQRRRKGKLGALTMGMEHGVYCLGCCWLLMALLFVGGVMNLYWIIALAVFVLVEKLLPFGRRVGLIAGAGLGLWGLGLMIGIL